MAYAQPQAWYIHAGDGATTGYYAIPRFAVSTAYTPGQLVRQLTTPAIGSERVFVSIGSGSIGSEPTWTLTKGSISGGLFQECTGEAGLNGDLTNCLQWTISSTPPLGRVIYDPTTASLQICTISAAGSATKPSFSATAGVTRTDGSAQWCSLGLASNFGPFAAPHARTLNAMAAGWGVAGNDFYLADNSAEVSTAQIVINVGTVTNPFRFFSVDHTQSLPATPSTLKPGASITSSVAALNAVCIGSSGNVASYWYGVSFIGTGAIAGQQLSCGISGNDQHRFESCKFQLSGSAISTAYIGIGGSGAAGSQIDLVNCTFSFNNAGQQISLGAGWITWRNTPDPIITGTIPTIPFRFQVTGVSNFLFEGVDFTSLGANTMFGSSFSGGFITIKNCKLGTGLVILNMPVLAMAVANIDIVNSDSGGAIYRNERYNAHGAITTSTRLARTGGATDGMTPVSHGYSQTTMTRSYLPFNGFPLVIWNDVIGVSRTLTVYGILFSNSNIIFNNQVWLEVEYMGDASSPNASRVSSGLATDLSAQTGYSGDTSAWDSALPARLNSHFYTLSDIIAVASNPGRAFAVTTAGNSAASEPAAYASSIDGGTAFGDGTATMFPMTRFKMSVSFTAQQKGYVTVYPKAGSFAISNPFYLDPLPVLS